VVLDVGLRRPTLDDVFLRLTADAPSTGGPEPAVDPAQKEAYA
jgi:hypothetical protein